VFLVLNIRLCRETNASDKGYEEKIQIKIVATQKGIGRPQIIQMTRLPEI
jgi:hypothetical protein